MEDKEVKEEEKEYLIYSEFGYNYYTKNKMLYDITHKYSNASDLHESFTIWGFGVFGLSVLLLFFTLFISELALGISFGCWIFLLLVYCCATCSIVEHRDIRYQEYIDIFRESDEYKKQYQAYCDENEKERQKRIEEKSKNLVEAYNILDNKKMSKEKKIELLKQYVEKGE